MNRSRSSGDLRSEPENTLVYLVRHGLTDWNVERRMQGQLDVPLNAEGMEQAQAVAGWLAARPVRFADIYSSDLLRARQTAQAISERLHLEPRYSAALREIDGGRWQGLSFDEVERQYPGQLRRWREEVDTFRLPGGESIPDVQRRAFAFYEDLVHRHCGEAIIIVSHGAALAALQAAIHGWDLLETWRTGRARLGNTGVSVVSVDTRSGRVEAALTNSMQHLANPTGMSSLLDPNGRPSIGAGRASSTSHLYGI